MVVVDSSATTAAVRRNSVLAALAANGSSMVEVDLVRLEHLDVVHEAGDPVDTVLFPSSCVISVATTQGDEALDVTTVGREGLVGLPGLLGADVLETRAVCRVPGEALRLPIAAARQLLNVERDGLAVLHRYVRGSVADLMQRIACNRAHGNEARCACWLAKTADRVGSEAFELTHATLATMLGVRRATVTESLALLQRNSVVRSARGTVSVLDRPALEAASCSCFAAFHRALPMATG